MSSSSDPRSSRAWPYALLFILVGIIFGSTLTLSIFSRRYARIAGRSVIVQHDVNGRSQWDKIGVVLDIVRDKYVDTLDRDQVVDAALDAALASLDPHSVYMPPVDLEAADGQLAGNFEGIGIQFNVPADTATVIEVISGGPSEKAGLLPGDHLLKVGDREIAGCHFPQDSMVALMRGPAGSKVTLLIDRQGEQFPVEIERGVISNRSADAAFMMDDGRTGYIRLSKFTTASYRDFVEAFLPLQKDGMKKLVLDLRENSGGLMDQAIYIARELLPEGEMIVYAEGRKFPREEYYAEGKGRLRDIELVVLIDEFSASASEILAGAIQDNDRGLIVGRRSFGKGLVQEPVYFTDGSGIRLTVARYYTPSGRCIQKPYTSDYEYETYDRYNRGGEVYSAENMHVDSSQVFYTRGGRKVYGSGGIVPDIFVPVDTTRASNFYVSCNRKNTLMRYASWVLDRYSRRLSSIDSFPDMDRFLEEVDIPGTFVSFARSRDGIVAGAGEWEASEPYMLPQLKALISRYSKLGENAFYKYYLTMDNVFARALEAPALVVGSEDSTGE